MSTTRSILLAASCPGVPSGGVTDRPAVRSCQHDVFLNLRVADIRARYDQWRSRGAEFLTPPLDRGSELRCYLRDPDGYLIEVGQSTGFLHGEHAAR
jgi:predicted enzyme related to lactoylglutathione lyase